SSKISCSTKHLELEPGPRGMPVRRQDPAPPDAVCAVRRLGGSSRRHGAEGAMERVTGIGGFFFRARDPEALTAWYQQHLGIGPAPGEMKEMPWMQEA